MFSNEPVHSLNQLDQIKSRTLSDAQLLKEGARYVLDNPQSSPRLELTSQQIELLRGQIETELSRTLITPENIHNGAVEIKLAETSAIDYEFELEEEQRIMVEAKNFSVPIWKNYVVDTYDQSGRCRIRIKNGAARLSLKIPLLSRDTERAKVCIRLEFKPKTPKQEADLLRIQELVLQEPGSQVREKWGTPLELRNGTKIYLNKDDRENYWIETDERFSIEEFLPEGVTYLQHRKSDIAVEAPRPNTDTVKKITALEGVRGKTFDKELFTKIFRKNLEATSRTAKGKVDTSVDHEKDSGLLEGEKLKVQIEENLQNVVDYIWTNSKTPLFSPFDVQRLVNDLVILVNTKISRDPSALRKWGEGYGTRKVPTEALPLQMKLFYQELWRKNQEVENGNLAPSELASWIELEIDHFIHPFADGCGRVAKAVSALFLARHSHPLPDYGSREEYYKQSMNLGEQAFTRYYRFALTRSIVRNYLTSS